MPCGAFQEGIAVVELGIVKTARHVCNGKAVRAGVVDLQERYTDDQLEPTESLRARYRVVVQRWS
ncbi:uncharacterized protein LACBIDRAFT_316860 [Laccaria bicolor S238N-H82]|uniref:Predicted protein n=1 Tax=Laccaria bicolor (strain S238N-H82 / ATCC MYA-4686) TaxID=486041 RepID=B0E1R9_LACBS|nr:uncharacterized protein LACBIDRAFT_316860 [Laccaria bicolor S238N-H82]EDQ99220.1 predicted protein [Laccaria bicolor S238N-H82]|eukprot:XP_001890117.1 predicted protein [Laccaria bicolor S238N-H82]